MAFRLFVDSDNGVTIEPEWDLKHSDRKIETRNRTRSGAQYVYKWGEYKVTKFSVMYVSSEFKSIVNSWWNNNVDLLWMEEGGSEITSIHLVNKDIPIGEYIKPYKDIFKGIIELETY